MTTYCTAEFVSNDDSDQPSLSCGKPDRFHVMHRDPTTGVRFMRVGKGAFVLETGARKDTGQEGQ